MRLLSLLLFCALAAASVALMFYLVLLGMAPGLPPLDYTGLFMYGPGPGFLLLPVWLGGALLIQIAAIALRRSSRPRRAVPAELAAWGSLGALLALQALMLADARGFI